MGSLSRLAIQRFATVGVVSGGSSAPPGDSTNYPTVATWAALSGVATPRRTGDRVTVTDSDGSGSTGIAQWSGSAWQLTTGTFATFALMTAFPNPIQTGAVVGVGSGAASSLMRYVYDGAAWVRVASGRAVVWTSSSVVDINTTDPSGIGITLPGDALRLTLATGARAFRLRRFTTAGGDIANADAWVPAEWLESGTVRLASYLVGTESSRGSAGLTDATSGGSAITGNISGSGYTRLAAGGAGSASMQVTGLSLASGQQIYIRAQMRGTAVGGTATAGLFSGDGTNVTQPIMNNSGVFQFSTIAGAGLNSTTLRSGGSVLPNTSTDGELIEMLDEGRTVLASLFRSGALYHTAKRNQIALASSFSGLSAANSGVLDVRYLVVITRTP
jgi:hypothetical protein